MIPKSEINKTAFDHPITMNISATGRSPGGAILESIIPIKNTIANSKVIRKLSVTLLFVALINSMSLPVLFTRFDRN